MLKVGAPVMLIKNCSEILVNGLCGRVANLDKESVTVHFPKYMALILSNRKSLHGKFRLML